jgi:hypothetical protein
MRFGERNARLGFLLVWDAEFVYLAFFVFSDMASLDVSTG